jgi:hypothetical protein
MIKHKKDTLKQFPKKKRVAKRKKKTPYLDVLREVLKTKSPGFGDALIEDMLEQSDAKVLDLSEEKNRHHVYKKLSELVKLYIGEDGADYLITEIRCNLYLHRKISESLPLKWASTLLKKLPIYDFRDKKALDLSFWSISKAIPKKLDFIPGVKKSKDFSKELYEGLKKRIK